MNYRQALIKRDLELIVMFPFVLLGKVAGHIFKLKPQRRIFLFFPSADIGGSIKVNADITECIKDAQPVIIFSKKTKNNGFRKLFDMEGVRVIDLHKYVDNKLYHFVNFFFRGLLASWINNAEDPVVFGGESLFFYKVVPHLKKGARCVELCHLNTWFNFSQAFVKYLDYRVFSTPQIKRDVENQYKKNGVPDKFLNRLFFVDNKIDIPPYTSVDNSILQVIFVGRGAPQKRVYLIAEIAKKMHIAGSNIHFSFVGDVENIIPEDVKKYTTLYGNLDKQELNKKYQQADVLLLTSAYEGLPIVVMDMMARGKIVVSTAVGGIPDYIQHKKNGFLITETEENNIVSTAIDYLNELIEDKTLRATISYNAYQYALAHFGQEQFCNTYRNFILGPTKS